MQDYNRQLRQEQDAEYQRSLDADRERERQRQAVSEAQAKARQEAEEAAAREKCATRLERNALLLTLIWEAGFCVFSVALKLRSGGWAERSSASGSVEMSHRRRSACAGQPWRRRCSGQPTRQPS